MFVIPHLIFLCLYSLAIERWGSQIHYKEIHPDFFLPVFVYLLHKSPYQHLVILVGMVGCVADVLQGHTWAQLTCWYVLLYLALDKMRVAQLCSNFFIYLATIIGISLAQPIWLKVTGMNYGLHHPIEQLSVNIVYSIFSYLIFKAIRMGWGIESHRRELIQ